MCNTFSPHAENRLEYVGDADIPSTPRLAYPHNLSSSGHLKNINPASATTVLNSLIVRHRPPKLHQAYVDHLTKNISLAIRPDARRPSDASVGTEYLLGRQANIILVRGSRLDIENPQVQQRQHAPSSL